MEILPIQTHGHIQNFTRAHRSQMCTTVHVFTLMPWYLRLWSILPGGARVNEMIGAVASAIMSKIIMPSTTTKAITARVP